MTGTTTSFDSTLKPRFPGLRLAALGGFLLFLACPVPALWLLAWVAVAPLILSVTRAVRMRQAFWRGYIFGWFFLAPVWYWVGLTIVAWTHSQIGWFAWFGLTLILALFYGFWGAGAWWLSRRLTGGRLIIALAAAWVIMEWARTLGAITMPWAQLSYTQYRFLPVLQFADVTGAYGVSFLIMLVNGALADWYNKRGQKDLATDSARWLWATLTLTGLLCLYGWARMLPADTGTTLNVAVMQGNFNAFVQQTPEQQMQVFTEMTSQASQTIPKPELYVWAESSAPGDAVHDGSVQSFLRGLALDSQAAVVVGSAVRDTKAHARANTAVLYDPDGRFSSLYNKRQLVPFGEFIPYRDLIPSSVAHAFDFPDDDVLQGKEAALLPFSTADGRQVRLGPFICYEAMYPNYAREMTASGANLLITQSNDSWFQSRAALEQHLAAVTLRAIENRREIARSTTTGITCILDSKGQTIARVPDDVKSWETRRMRLMDGKTLYTRFGDWFVAFCALVIAGLLYRTRLSFHAVKPA